MNLARAPVLAQMPVHCSRGVLTLRGGIILGLLTGWVLSVYVLIGSRIPEDASPAVTPAASPGGAQSPSVKWFELYLQGRKIGFMHYSFEPFASGARFVEKSVLRLNTLGRMQTIHGAAWGTLNAASELQEMRLALATDASTFEAQIVVDGELVIRAGSGGRRRLVRLPLTGPLYVPLGLRSALFARGMKEGTSLEGTVVDPMTQRLSRLRLQVIRREAVPDLARTEGWRVEETWRGLRSVLWVDDEGVVLREQGPMGLLGVASSEEEATRWEVSEVGVWDAVAAVAIPVRLPIDRPRHRAQLQVRLRGIHPQSVPAGEFQTWNGEVLTIWRPRLEELASYRLPYDGGLHDSELAATPAMQKDHPRLRALSRVILGPERDAAAAARLLLRWVYEYLAKIPVASVPDALETLDRGSGDCTEHAVLFAALARAAGIPARLVTGLVYGDERFLYHAWVEVWLGSWLPVDPALGQIPADATHIKLAHGAIEEQTAMIALFGKLEIEIVEVEGGARP